MPSSRPSAGAGTPNRAAPAFVALLRGINVGGRHKIAMADLRAMFSGLGFGGVATYIQSGNVVFTSTLGDVAELMAAIDEAIETTFGFRAPAVLRSAGQLAAVAVANPFLAGGADAGTVSVGFLAGVPTADRLSALLAEPLADPVATGGDEFVIRGADVYLHHPNGYGRTKLTNGYFDKRLGVMMTVRNWRTVLTLLDMASGLGAST